MPLVLRPHARVLAAAALLLVAAVAAMLLAHHGSTAPGRPGGGDAAAAPDTGALPLPTSTAEPTGVAGEPSAGGSPSPAVAEQVGSSRSGEGPPAATFAATPGPPGKATPSSPPATATPASCRLVTFDGPCVVPSP
jgi:hypothetical protein